MSQQMSELFLKIILGLALGPMLVVIALWTVAFLLAGIGSPRLLEWLKRKTHWGDRSPPDNGPGN